MFLDLYYYYAFHYSKWYGYQVKSKLICIWSMKTMSFIKWLKGRNIISLPWYIKPYKKQYSADLQLWDDGGERGSQLRHPCKHEDWGTNQLWAGEDAPSPTWGDYRGLPAHVTSLVIWLAGFTANIWIHRAETVRWDNEGKINQALQQGP